MYLSICWIVSILQCVCDSDKCKNCKLLHKYHGSGTTPNWCLLSCPSFNCKYLLFLHLPKSHTHAGSHKSTIGTTPNSNESSEASCWYDCQPNNTHMCSFGWANTRLLGMCLTTVYTLHGGDVWMCIETMARHGFMTYSWCATAPFGRKNTRQLLDLHPQSPGHDNLSVHTIRLQSCFSAASTPMIPAPAMTWRYASGGLPIEQLLGLLTNTCILCWVPIGLGLWLIPVEKLVPLHHQHNPVSAVAAQGCSPTAHPTHADLKVSLANVKASVYCILHWIV